MTTDHAPAEPSDCNDCSEGPRLPRHLRLATGELFWQQEDIRIAGRGLDFAWIRTYRSRPKGDVPHWDNAYNLKVEAILGDINVFNGAGAANLYRLQLGGGYAARGVFAEGRLNTSNQFRIRFAGGGAWEFRSLDERRAPGHIARIIDRNGNELRFGYNEAGRPEVITDALGRDIHLRYDRSGRLATLTDFTGRRLSYRYTEHGDLESVTLPACHWHPDRQRLSQRRNGHVHVLGAAPAHWHHRPSRQPLLDIEYSMAFDHERVSALRWGRSGKPTHFTYHPTDEGLAAVVAIVNDGNGNVRDLLFDKLDACVGARDYTARADAAIPTTRTENRPVHPVRPDEPPFYETRYHYDNPDGLLTRIVHPDGSTVEKQFEIDLRPDPSPIERGNLRTVRHTPGPRQAATRRGWCAATSICPASAAPAGRRSSPGIPFHSTACGQPSTTTAVTRSLLSTGTAAERRCPTMPSVMSSNAPRPGKRGGTPSGAPTGMANSSPRLSTPVGWRSRPATNTTASAVWCCFGIRTATITGTCGTPGT